MTDGAGARREVHLNNGPVAALAVFGLLAAAGSAGGWVRLLLRMLFPEADYLRPAPPRARRGRSIICSSGSPGRRGC